MRQRRYAEAVSFAEKEANAQNSEFWYTQLSLALKRMGDTAGAIENARKALMIAPRNSYALLAYADALSSAGRTSEALSAYEEAARDTATADRAQEGVFQCLAAQKNWTAVLERLTQGNDGRDYPYWRIRALGSLGRTDEAIGICEEQLKSTPGDSKILWALVELEITRDGLEQVMRRYERIAKIPSRPPVYTEIYASLCRRAGISEKAIAQYEKLEMKTTAPGIVRKKAFALAKTGKEDEAIPLFEELLRADPRDMYVNASYVSACRRKGLLNRAWKTYHDLIGQFPDEKTLLGRLKKISKELEQNPPVSGNKDDAPPQ